MSPSRIKWPKKKKGNQPNSLDNGNLNERKTDKEIGHSIENQERLNGRRSENRKKEKQDQDTDKRNDMGNGENNQHQNQIQHQNHNQSHNQYQNFNQHLNENEIQQKKLLNQRKETQGQKIEQELREKIRKPEGRESEQNEERAEETGAKSDGANFAGQSFAQAFGQSGQSGQHGKSAQSGHSFAPDFTDQSTESSTNIMPYLGTAASNSALSFGAAVPINRGGPALSNRAVFGSETEPPTEQSALLLQNFLQPGQTAPGPAPAHAASTRHKRRNTACALFFFAAIAVFVAALFVVRAVLAQPPAFEARIDNAALVGMSDGGVRVRVAGEVCVTGGLALALWLFRKLGPLASNGTVEPRQPSPVVVSGPELNRTHVVLVVWPPVDVDFSCSHWPFDVVADAQFTDGVETAVAAAWAAHAHRSQWLVEATVRAAARIRGVRVPLPAVEVRRTVAMGEIRVSTVAVAWHRSLEANATVSVAIPEIQVAQDLSRQSESFTDLEIPPIDWLVAVRDCAGRPVTVGAWASEECGLDSAAGFDNSEQTFQDYAPVSSRSLRLHGKIDEVSPEILRPCADGLSPIERVARGSPIVVWAPPSARNEKLPHWLRLVLRIPRDLDPQVVASPNISFNGMVLSLGMFGKGNFSHVAIEILPSNELAMKVTGSGYVEWPVEDAEVNANAQVILLLVASAQVCANGANGSVEVESADITVGDPHALALAANTVLSGRVPTLGGKVNLVSATLRLPLLATTFHNVTMEWAGRNDEDAMNSDFDFIDAAEVTAKLGNLETSQDNVTESPLDRLLAGAIFRADKLFYISSNSSSLELLADLALEVPYNVSLNIDTLLDADLAYNGTVVGRASLDRFSMAEGRANVSAGFRLACPDLHVRAFAEDLASHVVSGAAARVAIQNLQAGRMGLNEFVSALSPQLLTVPKIQFNRQELQETGRPTSLGFPFPQNTEGSSEGSPFLVGATIHLLSSQIEITVYNPLANAEIVAEILSSQASCEGQVVARIEHSPMLLVPPGLYTTPRMPIRVEAPGAALLRRALNGGLDVDTIADIAVRIGEFPMQLLYQASGLTAEVRL